MEHIDAILELIKDTIQKHLTFNFDDEAARDEAHKGLKSGTAKDHPLFVPLAALYDTDKAQYTSVKKKIAGRFKNKKGEVERDIDDRINLIRWQHLQDKIKPLLEAGSTFEGIERNKSGGLLPTVGNFSLVLRHLIDVKIAFDEFSGNPYFTKLPWSDKPTLELLGQKYHAMDEGNTARLQEYLSRHLFTTEVIFAKLATAVISVSLDNRINIYQRWMDQHKDIEYQDQIGELLPDTTEQNFNTELYSNSWRRCWLIKYLNVKHDTLQDVKWALVVARKFMIAIVQRCYEPACTMKLCMVLEGDQEIGKTPWIRSLAPCSELYVSVDLDDSKFGMNNFSRKVVGHTICEFEESGGINHRSDANRAKKVISMQEDHYDPKFYGHRIVKRSCLFVMSLNQMRNTLYDPTGATRFYPVASTATRKDPIDTDGFSVAYPQILAQAIALYTSGETAQLSSEEQDLQANESVKLQYVPDDDEQEWVDMFFESDSNTTNENGTPLSNLQNCRDRGWVYWEDVVKHQRGFSSSAERKDFSKHKRKINEGFKKWGFNITKTTKYDGEHRVKAYWCDSRVADEEKVTF